VFGGVRVARSLVFCVVFCTSLFVLLSFLWSLRCLSFDVRFLITTFVSPNVFSITWLNKCSDYYYDNSESRMINKFYTCIKNKR
jgi:hypothetical protein